MLQLYTDRRIGGETSYLFVNSKEGIMLVPDEVRKCVVFLACKTKDGLKIGGTAFFISTPIEKADSVVLNLCITAKHVIAGIKKFSIDQQVYIRINTRDGKHRTMKSSVDQWLCHPDDSSVDVAILMDPLPYRDMEYLYIPPAMIATDEIIKKEGIGIGDEVFITGLFVNHYGNQRNLPILRIGNIALMPEEPIQTQKLGNIEAYLIEARSLGGLSGSPVFVHLTGVRPKPGGTGTRIVGSQFYFLGLMHGHWNLPTKDEDVFLDELQKNERVNMGIAVVVPGTKILEVINQEKIKKRKLEIERAILEATSPTPDENT